MTASSLRRSSQPISSPGGTTSASWRLPRLRHLPASPNASLTTMSVRPASLRPAIRLDPMKPAPPVTNSIPTRSCWAPFAPGRAPVQLLESNSVKWPTGNLGGPAHAGHAQRAKLTALLRLPAKGAGIELRIYSVLGRMPGTYVELIHPDRPLHVDRRLRSLSHGGKAAQGAVAKRRD